MENVKQEALIRKKIEAMPNIKVRHRVSRDRKWYITETTITDFKAVSYIEKVLKAEPFKKEQASPVSSSNQCKLCGINITGRADKLCFNCFKSKP